MQPLPPLQVGGRRARVLIVDDSAVIRRVVQNALEKDPLIEVVGTANNGVMALERLAKLSVDVVTLDIEMPQMDGLETLRRIKAGFPNVRVIMFSTLTERGAAITIEALGLGAMDYVTKPSTSSSTPDGTQDKTIEALRLELIPKIKQFFRSTTPPVRTGPPPAAKPAATGTPAARPTSIDVVAIGVSTGGPTALNDILPQIPARFHLPVLIVQHMPPVFTKLLAERLSARCAIPVVEAAHGMPVEGGKVYIAPGNYHMRAVGQAGRAKIALDQGPQENSCRPAVDPLFRSVCEVWGNSAIAVILTGMGQDGLLGCEMVHAKGGIILAQDEATSVVWGMPGFIARAGIADKVLPLMSIVPEVLDRIRNVGKPTMANRLAS